MPRLTLFFACLDRSSSRWPVTTLTVRPPFQSRLFFDHWFPLASLSPQGRADRGRLDCHRYRSSLFPFLIFSPILSPFLWLMLSPLPLPVFHLQSLSDIASVWWEESQEVQDAINALRRSLFGPLMDRMTFDFKDSDSPETRELRSLAYSVAGKSARSLSHRLAVASSAEQKAD
jgi:hypothetical protein